MTTRPAVEEPIFYLIYLGKRGGGEQLLAETSIELSAANVPFQILASADLSEWEFSKINYRFDIPRNIKDLYHVKILRNFGQIITLLANLLKHRRNAVIVQLMPSPFDRLLDFVGNLYFLPIVRCIHDLSPHPGENWPTAKSIRRRMDSADHIYTFSDYIAEKIKLKGSYNCNVLQLPSSVFSGELESNNVDFKDEALVRPIIRVLGRAIAYKGYSILQKALFDIDETFTFEAYGEGKYPSGMSDKWKVENRWLSNKELSSKISSSDILIFPYIEASQSGLIPLAIAQEKIIVASNIGGLSEQVAGYESAILVEPGESILLRIGIKQAIDKWRSRQSHPNKKTNLVLNGNSVGKNLINQFYINR